MATTTHRDNLTNMTTVKCNRDNNKKKMFPLSVALVALSGLIVWPHQRGQAIGTLNVRDTWPDAGQLANHSITNLMLSSHLEQTHPANEAREQPKSKQYDAFRRNNSIKQQQRTNQVTRLLSTIGSDNCQSGPKRRLDALLNAQLSLFNPINDASGGTTREEKINETGANNNNNNSTSRRHKRDQRHFSDARVNSHGRSNDDSGYIWLHQSDNMMAKAKPSDASINDKRATNVITKRLASPSSYGSPSNLNLSSLSPHTKRTYITSYKDDIDDATSSLESDTIGSSSGSDYYNRDIKSEMNDFKGTNVKYNTNPNSNTKISGHSRRPAHMTTLTDNRLDNGLHATEKQIASLTMGSSKPFGVHHYPSYSLNHFDSTMQTNVSVNVGDTAYLTCKLRMIQDQLKVSWVRNMMILTSGDQRYTSDERFVPKHVEGTHDWILELKNINMEDKGSYECQINSDPSPASAHFYLDVTAATIKILEEPLKYVPVDDDIRLTCIANFDGPTTRVGKNVLAYNEDHRGHHGNYYYSGGQVKTAQYIYWYKDNISLNFNHPRSGIKVESRDNSTHMISDITIRQAKNTDSGYYKCNLLPEIGSVGPAQINVIVGEMSSASSASSDAGYLYNNSRASNWRQQQTLCGTCVLALLLIIVSSRLLVNSAND